MAENKNAQQVREITDKLEQGIKELFESEAESQKIRADAEAYTSSSWVPLVTYFFSWRMHSWVVSCIPVPKAVPGSM